MMTRSEQYRWNGEACLGLAAKTRSMEDRDHWLKLAQGWFDLAKNTDDRSSELKK
jgi:hypothetical protein